MDASTTAIQDTSSNLLDIVVGLLTSIELFVLLLSLVFLVLLFLRNNFAFAFMRKGRTLDEMLSQRMSRSYSMNNPLELLTSTHHEKVWYRRLPEPYQQQLEATLLMAGAEYDEDGDLILPDYNLPWKLRRNFSPNDYVLVFKSLRGQYVINQPLCRVFLNLPYFHESEVKK